MVYVLPEQEIFFNRLYQDNFQKLKRYAGTLLDDPSQAEEVAQDAFHTGIIEIEMLMAHEAPEKWLIVTVKNKARNCNRIHRRDLLRFMSLDADTVEKVSSCSAEELFAQRESYDSAVEKIEQALTTEEQYFLRRFVFDHVSHKELSGELGITLWACQKRMERIRKKLEKQFPSRIKKK